MLLFLVRKFKGHFEIKLVAMRRKAKTVETELKLAAIETDTGSSGTGHEDDPPDQGGTTG